MAEPTNYDKLQDDRLDSLESLITAEYEPPAGAQYSYPVANQGITQDQFNNMMLPMGAGIIHRGFSPYYLTGHESDAETNQRNTLILKVDSSDGFSGSSIAGFYHRLTEDMELPFPPVTTTTDYYVTVTYDPRRFKTDPLRIEVWADTPPRTHGQQHIILNRVRRQPNQLLSQAEITRYRQAVAPTIFVQNPAQLPAPADVLYGTIAATHSGSMHVSLGSSWLELNAPGAWQNLPLHNNGSHNPVGLHPQYRRTSLGVQFRGYVRAENRTLAFGQLPMGQGLRPSSEFYAPVMVSSEYQANVLIIGTDGQLTLRTSGTNTSFQNIRLDNIIMPID